MAIPPSGSDPYIAPVGAEGGGEGEGPPLEGAGVGNTGEEIQTGSGQVVEETEDDCITTCMNWVRHFFSEAAAEVGTSGETQPLTSEGAKADESGKTEKAKKPGIPKPDTPGAPVDLNALKPEELNKRPLDKAIETATGALENARQTSCYQYWAYKAEPKPSRDRTNVDEAQRILMQAVGLVRSFIAERTRTAVSAEKLVSLGLLATECEVTHAQIEKKLGDPDETEEDKTEEAAPVEEAGGSDDTTEVGGGDPSDEEDPPEESEPEQE